MSKQISFRTNESTITSIAPMSQEMQQQVESWAQQERSMRFSYASLAFAFPPSCNSDAMDAAKRDNDFRRAIEILEERQGIVIDYLTRQRM